MNRLLPAALVGLALLGAACTPASRVPPEARGSLLLADAATWEAHNALPRALRMGPWAHGVAPLTVFFDSVATRYDAVVVERAIVRDRPHQQLQSCSLTHTFLTAAPDTAPILTFGAADFGLPVAPREDCLLDRQSNPSPAAAPYVMHMAPGSFGQGVSGTARISLVAGSERPCPLATQDRRWRAPPPDQRCRLADFDVQLDALLEIREHQQERNSAPAYTRVTVSRQRVPGLRLTVFCSVNSSYAGCPRFPEE